MQFYSREKYSEAAFVLTEESINIWCLIQTESMEGGSRGRNNVSVFAGLQWYCAVKLHFCLLKIKYISFWFLQRETQQRRMTAVCPHLNGTFLIFYVSYADCMASCCSMRQSVRGDLFQIVMDSGGSVRGKRTTVSHSSWLHRMVR